MKHMISGERQKLVRDFELNFEDVETVDSEGIFNWATNTGQFYDFYYPQFEAMCQTRVDRHGHLDNVERTYKPQFLEWTPYELVPSQFADFLNGLSAKVSYKDCNKAANQIYDYYLQQFKESHAM